MKETQKVAILGSTGSIGVSAMEVLLRPGFEHAYEFEVRLLATHRKAMEALKQAMQLGSPAVYIHDAQVRRSMLEFPGNNAGVKALAHEEDFLSFLAVEPLDRVLVAMTDFRLCVLALEALLRRTDRSIKILLASKEPAVILGNYFKEMAARHGHVLLPVDSEPSAIFQCLNGRLDDVVHISRVYLTATGGPFYREPVNLKAVTPKMALAHPVWQMGQKITIDSATLINKALELMEISELFSLPVDDIEILIHPECLVHSMIQMDNGSILAQMGSADMRLPIHYAFNWPKGFHLKNAVAKIDFAQYRQIRFDAPDFIRFPCLKTALQAAALSEARERVAGRASLMAADEVLVAEFLAGRIGLDRFDGVLRAVLMEIKNWFSAGELPSNPRANLVELGLEIYAQAARKTLEHIAEGVTA